MFMAILVELSVEQPLIDLRLLRHSTFVTSTVIIAVVSVGLLAGFVYVPLFIQGGQGCTTSSERGGQARQRLRGEPALPTVARAVVRAGGPRAEKAAECPANGAPWRCAASLGRLAGPGRRTSAMSWRTSGAEP
jgi:hypothetical protein